MLHPSFLSLDHVFPICKDANDLIPIPNSPPHNSFQSSSTGFNDVWLGWPCRGAPFQAVKPKQWWAVCVYLVLFFRGQPASLVDSDIYQ